MFCWNSGTQGAGARFGAGGSLRSGATSQFTGSAPGGGPSAPQGTTRTFNDPWGQVKILPSWHWQVRIVAMLYFPLAEERNKWKMFSRTPLGPGPVGLFWVTCSVLFVSAFLLFAIADENFRAPVPSNPSFELKTYTLFVRYSFLRLSA